ncbi:MAG: DNA methyltransferase [Rikenellaceae bacterium]
MATGITKSHWDDSVNIISYEGFTEDTTYEINYKGKKRYEDVIGEVNNCDYIPLKGEGDNAMYYGDNADVLRYLLHHCGMKESVKLIYIDPPYGTNSIFQSRNQKSSYRDDLIGSHYLEFMRRRLILMKELLRRDGSVYVHLDNNMVSQIKVIMDEIFGVKNFRGMITRKKCSNKNSTKRTYGNISDYILFYSKSDDFLWNRPTVAWSDDKIKKEYPCIDEKTGRRYKKVPIHAPGVRNGETGKMWRNMMPPKGKHWQYTPQRLDEFDLNGEIYWSSTGNPRRKVFLDSDKGIPVQDIWLDVQDSLNQNIKITGYPTEKNGLLLERIIKASSVEGDLVLDCFAGSGTTLAIAQRLNRRWIGIDNSSEAIGSILKRFTDGTEKMGSHLRQDIETPHNQSLFEADKIELCGDKEALDYGFRLFSDEKHIDELQKLIDTYL